MTCSLTGDTYHFLHLSFFIARWGFSLTVSSGYSYRNLSSEFAHIFFSRFLKIIIYNNNFFDELI